MPSLTEAVAVTAPGLLVGATDWCTHPADLDVSGSGAPSTLTSTAWSRCAPTSSSRTPRRTATPDLEALRAAGVPVWVTYVAHRRRRVRLARADARRLRAGDTRLARRGRAAWADAARAVAAPPRGRADLAAAVDGGRLRHVHRARARRLGVDNALDGVPLDADRYPRIDLDDLPPGRPRRAARRAVPVHRRRRARGVPRRTARRWCRAGTSPGTARRWSRPPPRQLSRASAASADLVPDPPPRPPRGPGAARARGRRARRCGRRSARSPAATRRSPRRRPTQSDAAADDRAAHAAASATSPARTWPPSGPIE